MEHCEICDVQVPSEVVMRDHVKGKKHLRLAGLHQRQQQQAEKCVYVRGFPKAATVESLKAHFTRFGRVDRVYVDRERGQYAIVEFSEKHTVKRTLDQEFHFLDGKRLLVKPREVKAYAVKKKEEIKAKQATEESFATGVDHDEVINILKRQTSVKAQMKELVEVLQLTPNDLQARLLFQQNLQSAFVEFFPGCQVHQFGSSVNGMGVQGCDLDLLLDLNLDKPCDGSKPKALERPQQDRPYVGDIRAFRNHRDGVIKKADLQQVSAMDQIKLVARILSHCVKGCNHVLTIPSARCPVIKFVFQSLSLRCDLSLNNRLALRNTRLIQFYISLDPRVKPLLFTIRYWAKRKELAGNVNSGPTLTNYALTWMVIFHLQNIHPPVLPSVDKLAELTTSPSDKCVIEGWDCTFCEDRDKIPASQNACCTVELLQAFFKVYSTFDFNSQTVCPRKGQPTHITQFRAGDAEGTCDAAAEFKIGSINIQDPFVLSHNTASNVNEKTMVRFVDELKQAAGKCDQVKDQSDTDWGIALLFSESSLAESSQVTVGSCQSDMPLGVRASSSPYSFSLTLKSSKLPAELLRLSHGEKELKHLWLRTVCNFVLKILREALIFDCKTVVDNLTRLKDAGERDDDMTTPAKQEASVLSNVTTKPASKETYNPHTGEGDLTDKETCDMAIGVVQIESTSLEVPNSFDTLGKSAQMAEKSNTVEVQCIDKTNGSGRAGDEGLSVSHKARADGTVGSCPVEFVDTVVIERDLTARISTDKSVPVFENKVIISQDFSVQMSDMQLAESLANLGQKRMSPDSGLEELDCKRHKFDSEHSEAIQTGGGTAPSGGLSSGEKLPKDISSGLQCADRGQSVHRSVMGGSETLATEKSGLYQQQKGESCVENDLFKEPEKGIDNVPTECKTDKEMSLDVNPMLAVLTRIAKGYQNRDLAKPADKPRQENGTSKIPIPAAVSPGISEVLLEAHCVTKYRMWAGRKRWRRELRKTLDESFELEVDISKKLLRECIASDKAVLAFMLSMTEDVSSSHTALQVALHPLCNDKEFTCFYPFLRTYITKLVEKCLH